MRLRHWLTPLLSFMLTTWGSFAVYGQYPGAESSSGSGEWMSPAGTPAYYQPSGGGWPASMTAAPESGASDASDVFGPSYPAVPQDPSFYQRGNLPWPAVSPYDYQFSQQYNNEGLWYDNFNNRGRHYFASVGYVRSKTQRPKGLVGQPGALSYKELVLPIVADDLGLDDLADEFQGDAPSFFGSNADGGFGFWPPQGAPGFNFYDAQKADQVLPLKADGIRGRWGFTEADDTGVVWEAWWSGRDSRDFDAEDRISTRRITEPSLLFKITDSPQGFLTPIAPFTFERILQANLLNLGGLPLDDGTLQVLPDGSTIGGTTVPYDIEFRLKYETENAGTSLAYLMSPIINRGLLKVQPLIGARYMFLREEFSFFGQDSGLAYDNQDLTDDIFPLVKLQSIPNKVDDDDPRNGVIDDAGRAEPLGMQQSNDEVRFVRLDLVAQILNDLDPTRDIFHPGRYQAFLDNEAQTHLAGPEIGLQYSLGGDKIKLRGHTKFGLMANHEELNLRGDNIGNANDIAVDVDFDPTTPAFIDGDLDVNSVPTIKPSPLLRPTPQNPHPNAFQQDDQHTHVSPLIEQSIYLDVPVLHYVPLVNRVKLFEDATLTIGYTFLFVDQVARPADSIRWQGNPRAGLFPSIKLERGRWWNSSWSFSVEVPY